jgi:hypothetical protein
MEMDQADPALAVHCTIPVYHFPEMGKPTNYYHAIGELGKRAWT